MFKKKPIYIVGIVIFTLILIADVAIYFLAAPRGNVGGMPSFEGGTFDAENFGSEMPEGFDAENFNPESFGGQMPGGSFSMPENGEMPEGFDAENFGGQMPSGQMSGGGRANNSVLGMIRSAFLPILIVCVLGDALCIFMLIRISKKKKLNPAETPDEEDEVLVRHDHTNTWLTLIALILVGALVLNRLPSGDNTGERETESTILQKEAVLNDIAATFAGSGTLQSSDAAEITIPAAVTVTSYTVKNGDYVEAGDVIANVDRNSVMAAIYEVQALMDEMDAEIAEVQENTFEDEIIARAAGRVKAIYVTEDASISGAMYEHGALMLISLGGSMTVEITSDAEVKVGQALVVTLSDASQIEGKVQQIQNGRITITTTDDGPIPGDAVTVAAEEGTVLGAGTLEISSSLKVTGFAGTVEEIEVEVDDEVEVGDTLLTLENAEDHARYQQLLRERDALVSLERELAQMYQDGTIKTEQSGIVSQISEDSDYAAASAAAGMAEVKTSAATATSALRSNASAPAAATKSLAGVRVVTIEEETPSGEEPTQSSGEATQPTEEATQPTEEPTQPTEEPSQGGDLPPSGGEVPPSTEEPTQPGGGETQPGGETPPGGENFPGGEMPPSAEVQADGTYAGKITKVSYGALQIAINEADMTGVEIVALETMDETGFTVQKQYSPDVNVPVYMYQEGQSIPTTINALQTGDKVLLRIENGTVVQIDFIVGTGVTGPSQGTFPGGTSGGGQGALPGGTSGGGFTGGSMQMPSGNGNYQQTETEEEELAVYEVETRSLCAITPSETMTIQVSVDELDVLALKEGQAATITLDALPGQSFAGQVKEIPMTGTAETGGSTKFMVIMEVPRTEQMLDGMNASVKIEVGRQEGVLTVPAEAVYEDGTRTYTYTGINEETGELMNAVDVETGNSDGVNIEIVSGLSKGDTVYYKYAEKVVYRFTNEPY